MHPPGGMFDEKQHVQCLQPQRLHSKKVAGQELILVVVEEAPPRVGRALGGGWQAMTVHDVADGDVAHIESQLAHLAFQFLITQPGVLPCYPEDPALQLSVNRRPARFPSLFELPL